jgi:hypothetical protein
LYQFTICGVTEVAKPFIDVVPCTRILFQRQNQREADDEVVPESVEHRIPPWFGEGIWGEQQCSAQRVE